MGSSCEGRRMASTRAPSSMSRPLVQVDETVWEIPVSARADMRVPARVFADAQLLDSIAGDESLEQLTNVATLDGVVAPGGVGYDINCGVRLLALPLPERELGSRRQRLVHEISRSVPAGAGKESRSARADLDRVLREGSTVLGSDEDVEHTESRGCLPGADPGAVSDRAKERGRGQIGTMGSGNHFVEVQGVNDILDRRAAEAFGAGDHQVTVLIHSGSRGLGHQVCTDYVKLMDGAMRRYALELPDRQLACCPASSSEGESYLAAMAAAANFAWANRQGIANSVRRSVERVLGKAAADGTRQIY